MDLDNLLLYGGVKVSESPFWIDMVTNSSNQSLLQTDQGRSKQSDRDTRQAQTLAAREWVINRLLELGKLSSDSATVFVSICFHGDDNFLPQNSDLCSFAQLLDLPAWSIQ